MLRLLPSRIARSSYRRHGHRLAMAYHWVNIIRPVTLQN